MHGTDDAAAREEGTEDAEQEGGKDQPDVPNLHHAALFLHHHGMEEGGAGEPRKQGGIFNRVPAPVAAPTEDGVSPVRAKKNANGLETPGDHGPLAGKVNPLLTGIAGKESGKSKSERNSKAGVAGIEVWRMVDHFR